MQGWVHSRDGLVHGGGGVFRWGNILLWETLVLQICVKFAAQF